MKCTYRQVDQLMLNSHWIKMEWNTQIDVITWPFPKEKDFTLGHGSLYLQHKAHSLPHCTPHPAPIYLELLVMLFSHSKGKDSFWQLTRHCISFMSNLRSVEQCIFEWAILQSFTSTSHLSDVISIQVGYNLVMLPENKLCFSSESTSCCLTLRLATFKTSQHDYGEN